MKKLLIFVSTFAISVSTWAGGLVTNTNQNAAFLRQLSQEAIVDITGLYMNPAGTAFLEPGGHFSLNIQNAKQNRDITTTYPLMAYNVDFAGNPTRKYEGEANAPVIPSLHWSYNWEKWSINANFALGGGGGKCEFDNGLGTFESLYAASLYQAAATQVIPTFNGMIGAAVGVSPDYAYRGYSMDAYMKGRQYYFGLSLGTTYKVLDNVAVFGGVRAVYATCNYNGWVQDVAVHLHSQLPSPYIDALAAAGYADYTYKLADNELSMNADQTGMGFTPMLGLDWKINSKWNVAAKYEFKTRLRLENKSEMNDYTKLASQSNATLGQFADGTKIAADIPSLFTVGAQYAPIESVRLQAGYHSYGDKNATQYGNKQDKIDSNTWEITAGAEWDVCDLVTLSCGWQTTQYGLSDAYMNDLSFVTNSNSYGCGFRLNFSEAWKLDFGFMTTIYDGRDVTTANYLAPGMDKTDHYKRTNRVFGIGLNYAF